MEIPLTGPLWIRFIKWVTKLGKKKSDIGVLSTSKDWVSADFNKFDLKLKTIMHAIELAKVLDFENR